MRQPSFDAVVHRAFACMLAVVASIAAMPDATPLPATRCYPDIRICGEIEIDEVWRDEDLVAILNRPGATDPLDDRAIDAVLHSAPQAAEASDLALDPRLSDHAEVITAPPVIDDDLPLQ